jgi:hypothetical protein
LGVYDGISFPYGFGVRKKDNSVIPAEIDLSEPSKLIRELYELGIEMFNITAGNPHYKPFVTRPYDKPINGVPNPPEHPLISVNRILNLSGVLKGQIKNKIIN